MIFVGVESVVCEYKGVPTQSVKPQRLYRGRSCPAAARYTVVSKQNVLFWELKVTMDQVDAKHLMGVASHEDFGESLEKMLNVGLRIIGREAVVPVASISMSDMMHGRRRITYSWRLCSRSVSVRSLWMLGM
jgi:hypothetical protein